MTLLTVENLNASIEGVPVLRNISVSVEEGETVALVGRNGAGKTTTLQTIMGLLAITNGTITFRNEAIAGLSTHERKRRGIGFAPEDRRLISNLTARENIQLSLWGTDDENAFDATERFEEVLNLFPEMESFLDRGARHLSGGEQQMVTVSRALIADPDLLLLD